MPSSVNIELPERPDARRAVPSSSRRGLSTVTANKKLLQALEQVLLEEEGKASKIGWRAFLAYFRRLENTIVAVCVILLFVSVRIIDNNRYLAEAIVLLLFALINGVLDFLDYHQRLTHSVKKARDCVEAFREAQDTLVSGQYKSQTGSKFGLSSASTVHVFRDGSWDKVPSNMLVEGDLIKLAEGDIAPVNVISIDYVPPFQLSAGQQFMPQNSRMARSISTGHRNQQFQTYRPYWRFEMCETPCQRQLRSYFSSSVLSRRFLFHEYLEKLRRLVLLANVFGVVMSALASALWYGKRHGYTGAAEVWENVVLHPVYLSLSVQLIAVPLVFHSADAFGNARLITLFEYLHDTNKNYENRLDSIDADGQEGMQLVQNSKLPFAAFFRKFWKEFKSGVRGSERGDMRGSTNLLHKLSSTTAFACVDKDGVLSESSRFIEEIFVLEQQNTPVVLDVHPDAKSEHGLKFEDPRWRNHLSVLKPLGLSFSVNLNPLEGQNVTTIAEDSLPALTPSCSTISVDDVLKSKEGRDSDILSITDTAASSSNVGAGTAAGAVETISLVDMTTNHTICSEPLPSIPMVVTAADEMPHDRSVSNFSTVSWSDVLDRRDTDKTDISVRTSKRSNRESIHAAGEALPLDEEGDTLVLQECLCPLSKEIGFSDNDIFAYTHRKGVWTIAPPSSALSRKDTADRGVGTFSVDSAEESSLRKTHAQAPSLGWIDYSSTPHKPNPHLLSVTVEELSRAETFSALVPSRPIVIRSDSRVEPIRHMLASVVEDSAGNFQLFSKGNPSLVLEHCQDYWDGKQIGALLDEDRRKILDVLFQWRSEEYDCIAFAYKPIRPELKQAVTGKPITTIGAVETERIGDESLQQEDIEVTGGPRARARPKMVVVFEDSKRYHRSRANRVHRGKSRELGLEGEEAASEPHEHTGQETVDKSKRPQRGWSSKSLDKKPVQASKEVESMRQNEDNEKQHDPDQPMAVGSVDGTSTVAEGTTAHKAKAVAPEVPFDYPFEVIEDHNEEDVIHNTQDQQIFLGMVAMKDQPKKEISSLIEDLNHAGIKFIHFSKGDDRATKTFGDKMGLDTDWNTCISLVEDSTKSPKVLINMGGKTVLPAGLDAIRKHLEEVDNVPLLVSLFSDAQPDSAAGMIEILQQNGEVVTVLGSSMNPSNTVVFQQADLAISITPLPPSRCDRCFGRSSASVQHQLTEEAIVSGPNALSSALNSLPCALELHSHANLYMLFELFRDARRLMSNFRQTLLFCICASILLFFMILLSHIFAIPMFCTGFELIWLLVIVIPSLSLSFLASPSYGDTMKRMPSKTEAGDNQLTELRRFLAYYTIRLVPTGVMLLCIFVLHLHLCLEQTLSRSISWQSLVLGEWFYLAEENPFAFGAALYNAQAFLLFLLVFYFSVLSMGFLSRIQPVLVVKPWEKPYWLALVVVNLAVHVAIVAVMVHLYGDQSNFVYNWEILLFLSLWTFLIVFVDEVVKSHDRKVYQRFQKRLRIIFNTKLGMHSPK